LSDNYKDTKKDASNIKADSQIARANIENVALSYTNDLNKWYSEKHKEKLSSRLETNVEQEDTDGITTNVEKNEGVQTNVSETSDRNEDITSFNRTTFDNKEVIKTKANKASNSENNSGEDAQEYNSNENTRNSSYNSFENESVANNKASKSKIKTKANSKQHNTQETINKEQAGNVDNQAKIQTRINRTQKGSELVRKTIKTKKAANRVGKFVVRKGKKLQTSSEGNIGEAFTSEMKDTSMRTAGKAAEVSTRSIRQKIRTSTAKLVGKIVKTVFNVLAKLLKSLAALLAEASPVIVIGAILLILLSLFYAIAGGIAGSVSGIFGEYAENNTISSYVDYMNQIDSDLNTKVDWKAAFTVIHCLDMDIKFDDAEQYILEEFNKADLYSDSCKPKDFTEWLNKNYSVVNTFYRKKGQTNSATSITNEDLDLMKELYDSDKFMKLIDEKRKSSVNTGTISGSTGDGSSNGKLDYPTSYRTISAGYPNYSSGKYHGGIDFPCPTGTKVCAAADGKVIAAKELNYSYGHYIIIDHGNGLTTLYAHNSKLLVGVGDTVTKGQAIAYSGSTGNSTGPHCHFEVRVNGVRVNPENYL
jgi:murein DD-endopeptidase MepM/ murein hydrolase activator NlpD